MIKPNIFFDKFSPLQILSYIQPKSLRKNNPSTPSLKLEEMVPSSSANITLLHVKTVYVKGKEVVNNGSIKFMLEKNQ